jgi:hypothetical protein
MLCVYADACVITQGAGGIANLLFGDASPSGRLPVSFVFNNYTQQIEMTDMRITAWPGDDSPQPSSLTTGPCSLRTQTKGE